MKEGYKIEFHIRKKDLNKIKKIVKFHKDIIFRGFWTESKMHYYKKEE